MLGDHALLLKGPMLYDVAVRVPLIVSMPDRLAAGRREDGFVSVLDLATTFRAAAGLEPYPRDQGRDLVAVGNGETPARNYAWSEYRNSGYPYEPPAHTTMYRTHEYKVVVWHGDPDEGREATGELYDMVDDPDELVNLWDDPAYRDVRMELVQAVADLEMKHEDRHQHRVAPW